MRDVTDPQALRATARVVTVPGTIQVGHLSFPVFLARPGEHGLEESEWGRYDPFAQTIVVRDEGPDDLRLSTTLHEALHALSDVYNAKLSERQVRALEVGLQALLRDNPLLTLLLCPALAGSGGDPSTETSL